MGIKDALRRIVPISNSAYHSRMNQLSAQMGDLEHQEKMMQQCLQEQRCVLESLRNQIVGSQGYYLIAEPGYPNFGDELIAREWVKYLYAKHPEVPVYIDCLRPGPAAVLLRGIHPHLTVVDTISRLTFENEYSDNHELKDRHVDAIAGFVHDALNEEGKAARYAAGIRLLQNDVRSVHILGGGYMNDQWPNNLARLELGNWCSEHDIPAIATGVGLVPLGDKSSEYVRAVTVKYEYFSVRDEQSEKILSGLNNCAIAPDDCFINGLEECYAHPEGLPDYMLCIQSDFVDDYNALSNCILSVLYSWGVAKDTRIGVVECMPYVDYWILKILQDAGYTVTLFPLAWVWEHGFPARSGQCWLSTRYHPHILAAAKGCEGSFISISEQYYDVKHQAVRRMGSRWSQVTIGQAIPEPGAGFADIGQVQRYRDDIRHRASVLYGL